MTIISSHVLDAVKGDHAAGIHIACYALFDGQPAEQLFALDANDEGRIAEKVDIDLAQPVTLELVFQSSAYFEKAHGRPSDGATIPEIVVRIAPTADKPKVHVPIMLSPHSYSIWWSS